MVGIIIISETRAAHEMLKSVKRLLGEVKNIKILQMSPPYTLPVTQKKLEASVKEVNKKKGVLILNDFYGSTQCNICMPFLKKGEIEMITGYNLPLLLKLLTVNTTASFKELMKIGTSYGKSRMTRVSGEKSAPKKKVKK